MRMKKMVVDRSGDAAYSIIGNMAGDKSVCDGGSVGSARRERGRSERRDKTDEDLKR